MTDVHLTPKPPETILTEEPAAIAHAIGGAAGDRSALESIAATYPRSMQVWAALATTADSTIERTRSPESDITVVSTASAEGWRGAGYVRYEQPSNRGFLDCLRELQAAANEIGETDEAQRCTDFLRQLDPEHRP